MEKIYVDWNGFVEGVNNKTIKPTVDINKGHTLIKSPIGPSNWRYAVTFFSTISTLAIPVAIVLFFFVKWWIPVIIIVVSIMFVNAIREESAKAVIEESLKNEEFYLHAVNSETMFLYAAKNDVV